MACALCAVEEGGEVWWWDCTLNELPPPPSNSAGAFENTVQMLYKYAVPKPKSECTKGEQLGVSFAAGYIAGARNSRVDGPFSFSCQHPHPCLACLGKCST